MNWPRESHRRGGPGNRDVAILQRLTQHLQNVAMELGEFVQEQDAAVREADLAGHGVRATAEQAGIGDGVMRRAKNGRRATSAWWAGKVPRCCVRAWLRAPPPASWAAAPEASRLASMVFPVPGGPIISRLWPR